jgi:4-amino-4-deoxy-L-arabinose transferase-like glycosyltransferase
MLLQRGVLLTTTLFLVASMALSGVLPLWLDEILQLIETRHTSVAEMIARLPRNSGAAPLGYLVQRVTLGITGYSVRRARLPAAIFGIATVFSVALLAAALGVRHGWLAAAVFAVFPATLRYATESRVYSQALFFSVLATLLYVYMAKQPTRALWGAYYAGYCIALIAAIYTQPYSACIAFAHLLWSAAYREFKTLAFGGAALAFTIITFLPWYLWSKAAWAAGIAREGFHFTASPKVVLMLFREVPGAGYWGSAVLLVLCALALVRRPSGRTQTLLLLLIAAPLASVLAADALANYFVASRQFIWILPAAAILAATAIEQYRPASAVLYAVLAAVCLRQSVAFFTSPGENWDAAAAALADQKHQGACLAVAPPESARLYAFFYPELASTECQGPRMVLAITPYTTSEQRRKGIAMLTSRGYKPEEERMVGRSTVLFLRRLP